MSGLRQRVLTGSAITLAALVLFAASRLMPALLVASAAGALLTHLCVWELTRMGTLAARLPAIPLFLGALALSAGSFSVAGRATLPGAAPIAELYGLGLLLALGATFLGALICGLRGSSVLELGFFAAWLLPPLHALFLFESAYGFSGLCAFVLLSKIGDNFGFFVGRRFGRRHPFPRLSPGKTLEGCIASSVGTLAMGACVGWLGWLPQGRLGLSGVIAAALVTNVAAQAGDLVESSVKRRAGVKDSSSIAGASGGLLDVLDSLLLSAPVSLLAWPWLLA